MDTIGTIGSLWPIALAFVTVTIALARMHADIETIKEKIRVLFELWNKDK